MAGALADGFVTHMTNSHPRFLRERCLPALADGARRAGRTDGGPRVVVVSGCVTAPTEAALAAAREAARQEFAFLYSTPAYRPTLDLLGYAEIGERLSALVAPASWDDLPGGAARRGPRRPGAAGDLRRAARGARRWYGGLAAGWRSTCRGRTGRRGVRRAAGETPGDPGN